MTKALDLVGKQFGRFTVSHRVDNDARGRAQWLCRCACGGERTIASADLTSGHRQSCGCLRNEIIANVGRTKNRKHGCDGTVEYRAWISIRQRCGNPNDKDFASYGGRGIKVCERWKTFENFLADMGRRPSAQHSIDRKHNDGDYEPDNCRWATKKEQANNRRSNRKETENGIRL